MEFFDLAKNNIFIGNSDKLLEWAENDPQIKAIEKVQSLLKNYLELDNVSFLFGSGSSIHLGAVAIRDFPYEVEKHIIAKDTSVANFKGIYKELIDTIALLQHKWVSDVAVTLKIGEKSFKTVNGWSYSLDDNVIRDGDSLEISIEYEKVLNYLIAKDYVLDEDTSKVRVDKIKELIIAVKEGLFLVCNVDEREVPISLIKRKKGSPLKHQQHQGQLLETESKYLFHEKFLKSLLQRPLNLRRANIFTANYDLAFEYAFDRLGVHYIDGFSGFHKRFFKPETFEYDIFYPGSTTSGKVQRIEKVLRYFKLHGSLSWVNSEKRDANNLYGIEEMPLKLIEIMEKKGEIIIYPSAVKKAYTLDLPYSELFRQFASTITQSQSVLITVGYAFADDHFNDIIFQALSNPTFTLIIVDFNGTLNNANIERIKNLNDSRIIILQGAFFGDFLTLADTLMPDFYSLNSKEKVAKTLDSYFNNKTA